MEKLYIDRFTSFENSLNSLSEAESRDRKDSFVISGTIQKFSLAFDLSWKLMKDILLNKYKVIDFALGSPLVVLKKSYENNLIKNDFWTKMLRDRNNLIHDYDGKIADEAIDRIIDIYIPIFNDFKQQVVNILDI